VHNFCGLATERILKFAIARKSSDNITAVMVAFEGLGAKLEKIRGRDLKEKQ
jgi:serine/threonine protein phosphatase PrpC